MSRRRMRRSVALLDLYFLFSSQITGNISTDVSRFGATVRLHKAKKEELIHVTGSLVVSTVSSSL